MTKKVEVSLTYVILRRAQDDISFDGACPEPVEGLRMTFPSIRRRTEDNPTRPLWGEGDHLCSAQSRGGCFIPLRRDRGGNFSHFVAVHVGSHDLVRESVLKRWRKLDEAGKRHNWHSISLSGMIILSMSYHDLW